MAYMCECRDELNEDESVPVWSRTPQPEFKFPSTHFIEVSELELARWALVKTLEWKDDE